MPTGLVNNFPAMIAIVGAGLTALIASLRFFSEKAAKITDFRKAWIETLRMAVAEFSANTHAISGRVAIRSRHSLIAGPQCEDLRTSQGVDASAAGNTATGANFDQVFESELLPHWVALRLAHNTTILHLNPQEHVPFLKAEMELAAYYTTMKDAANEATVHDFLSACLDHAYDKLLTEVSDLPCRTACVGEKSPVGPFIANEEMKKAFPGAENLFACEMKPPEALLLAMFATRQLLHGPYNTLASRTADIEHGIRVVDTQAAVVIKYIWSEIKNGEPGYRNISWISLTLSLLVLTVVFVALLVQPPGTAPAPSIKFSCRTLPLGTLAALPFFDPYLHCETTAGG